MESRTYEQDWYNKMKTYIHVNQHKIRANKKHGTNEPVITIKQGRRNTYCHAVKVLGDSVIRYGGNDKPILSCGARVVIETDANIEVIEWKYVLQDYEVM